MRMFDMANDSGLFRNHRQLRTGGATLEGMNWRDRTGALWLPLYEAKMIHHYDHRWATYGDAPSPLTPTLSRRAMGFTHGMLFR